MTCCPSSCGLFLFVLAASSSFGIPVERLLDALCVASLLFGPVGVFSDVEGVAGLLGALYDCAIFFGLVTSEFLISLRPTPSKLLSSL